MCHAELVDAFVHVGMIDITITRRHDTESSSQSLLLSSSFTGCGLGGVAFLPAAEICFHAFRGVAFLPVTVAAMADANFLAMARGFGSMLPPERQAFWDGVLQNYEDGIFTQELVLQNLYALQGQPTGAPAASAAQAPAGSSGPTPQAVPGAVPKAWQNPPQAVYMQDVGQMYSQPGWVYPNQFQGPAPAPQQAFPQQNAYGFAGVFSDHANPPNMFHADPWQKGKGNWKGKGKQGKGQQKGKGYKGEGKTGDKGGKQGGGLFRRRPVVAQSLEEAEERLDAFMEENPNFIFRPREEVPPQYEDVYHILGENGPQLWKCLRHHLTGTEGEAIAGRVLQYMAERSTWRADKMNQVDTQRRQRREQDANTSRMSVATGCTGMSTQTLP